MVSMRFAIITTGLMENCCCRSLLRQYAIIRVLNLIIFLCWANEPWARTWDGHETDVLMPQRYGDRLGMGAAFSSICSAFFKDQYYEKNR